MGGSSCWGSRTHQIETKYNLWHFQTSKVERFYENSFRKLIDWFHKTLPINSFYVFLVKMLNLKKARNIYTRMLEFTFPGADMINQNGGWKSGRTLQYKTIKYYLAPDSALHSASYSAPYSKYIIVYIVYIIVYISTFLSNYWPQKHFYTRYLTPPLFHKQCCALQPRRFYKHPLFTSFLIVFTVDEVCFISYKYQPPNNSANINIFTQETFISLLHFERKLALFIAKPFPKHPLFCTFSLF